MTYRLVYKLVGVLEGSEEEIESKEHAITIALSLINVYAENTIWDDVEYESPQVWKIGNTKGDYFFVEEKVN